MNVPAHAKLSASSSDRWLNCTAAPTMEAAYPDERSEFAAEGTRAHELAERCLRAGRDTASIGGDWPQDMRDYVQNYLDYVRAIPGELLVEQRLSLQSWIPDGFGTSDTVILDDGHMSIVDLKYGKGIKVDAEQNTQLMLYALGAFDAFDAIYGPITDITIVIAQPRLGHFDEWKVSSSDLLAWGESIKPIAQIAYTGPGTAVAGSHCGFCRARHTCRTRAEINLQVAKDEMGEWCPPSAHLSDDELAELYPKLDSLVRWANDLSAHCLTRAEAGVKFKGLKLVEGISRRKWLDEDQVIARMQENDLDPAEFTKTTLIGLTDFEKTMGKKDFTEMFGDLLHKPSGKPTLVPATDKRPEYDPSHKQAAIAEMSNA